MCLLSNINGEIALEFYPVLPALEPVTWAPLTESSLLLVVRQLSTENKGDCVTVCRWQCEQGFSHIFLMGNTNSFSICDT